MDGARLGRDDRLRDGRARDPHAACWRARARCPPLLDRQHHVRARRPLISAVAASAGEALERAAVHRHDHVAALQPRARGRRGVEDALDQQPARSAADLDADAREVRRLVEFARIPPASGSARRGRRGSRPAPAIDAFVSWPLAERAVVVVARSAERFVDHLASAGSATKALRRKPGRSAGWPPNQMPTISSTTSTRAARCSARPARDGACGSARARASSRGKRQWSAFRRPSRAARRALG